MIRFVFIDALFSAMESDLSALPSGVHWQEEKDKWQLHVPAHCELLEPIYCLYLTKTKQHTPVQRELHLAENSSLTWIEEYRGETPVYTTECQTTIVTEKNARLHYHSLQNEAADATHVTKTLLTQHQDSSVYWYALAIGGKTAKNSLSVHLQGRGANCVARGVYWLDADQQTHEQTCYIDHGASLSASSLLFKGVLQKKSRAAWSSKVRVTEDAKNIQSHQANHNVLLSNDAEVSTKPELEIYADEVKCSHGATIGQLNEEALFYLRSRGILESAAKEILMQAFIADVFQEMTDKTASALWQTTLLAEGVAVLC